MEDKLKEGLSRLCRSLGELAYTKAEATSYKRRVRCSKEEDADRQFAGIYKKGNE